MNITLKQDDIEKAVKMYIERQGFHLHNKTVAIDFSMGRGDNGLSAILTIEDSVHIPGFSHDDEVVKTQAAPSAAVQAMVIKAATSDSDAKVTATATPAPAAAVVDEVVEEAKTDSSALKEAAEALLAPGDSLAAAAVLQEATPVATAEAKTAEAPAAATATASTAEAKPTTSLFG